MTGSLWNVVQQHNARRHFLSRNWQPRTDLSISYLLHSTNKIETRQGKGLSLAWHIARTHQRGAEDGHSLLQKVLGYWLLIILHWQVESVTATKARLLYNAGITSVDLLVTTEEARIAEALAVGIRRLPVSKAQAMLKIGIMGSSGTNALVARDAQRIVAGDCLPHLIQWGQAIGWLHWG